MVGFFNLSCNKNFPQNVVNTIVVGNKFFIPTNLSNKKIVIPFLKIMNSIFFPISEHYYQNQIN